MLTAFFVQEVGLPEIVGCDELWGVKVLIGCVCFWASLLKLVSKYHVLVSVLRKVSNAIFILLITVQLNLLIIVFLWLLVRILIHVVQYFVFHFLFLVWLSLLDGWIPVFACLRPDSRSSFEIAVTRGVLILWLELLVYDSEIILRINKSQLC